MPFQFLEPGYSYDGLGDAKGQAALEELLAIECRHCGEPMEIEGGMLVVCHCAGSLREMQAFEDRTRVLALEWQAIREREAEERIAEMKKARKREGSAR